MYCFFPADAMTHRTCARFLYSGGFGVCTRVWCLFFITIGTNRDIRDISGYYEQRSSDNFTNMKNAGVLRYLVFEFCERRGRLCSSRSSFLVSKAMNCLYFIRKSDRSFHSVLSNCYWFLIKKKVYRMNKTLPFLPPMSDSPPLLLRAFTYLSDTSSSYIILNLYSGSPEEVAKDVANKPSLSLVYE